MGQIIKAHIVKTKDVKNSLIDKALAIINKQHAFQIKKSNAIISDLDDKFKMIDCFKKLVEFRETKVIRDDEFVILLTNKVNEENWFSAFNYNLYSADIFVQCSDWENYVFTDLPNIVAYQIVMNILQFDIYHNYNDFNWTHDNSIGCMNDMCTWKPDVQLKLKTGDICNKCLEDLDLFYHDYVIKDAIKIFNDVRMKTISTSSFYDPPDFDKQNFTPLAITKRKISTSSDPLRKSLFAIDHFDLLVKLIIIFSISILLDKEKQKQFLLNQNISTKPSLGNWVNALSNLREIEGGSGLINPVENIQKEISDILSISSGSNIVSLRNEYRGHGYVSCTDKQYTSVFHTINDALTSIENRIQKLYSDFSLIKILSAEWVSETEYKVRVNKLLGSNMIFQEDEIILKESHRLIKGRIYLVRKDYSEFFTLYPHIIFDNCPECNHPRIMIRDGEVYIDIYMGHRVSINSK